MEPEPRRCTMAEQRAQPMCRRHCREIRLGGGPATTTEVQQIAEVALVCSAIDRDVRVLPDQASHILEDRLTVSLHSASVLYDVSHQRFGNCCATVVLAEAPPQFPVG